MIIITWFCMFIDVFLYTCMLYSVAVFLKFNLSLLLFGCKLMQY